MADETLVMSSRTPSEVELMVHETINNNNTTTTTSKKNMNNKNNLFLSRKSSNGYYTSNTMGQNIVNGVTGKPYRHLVGSKGEYLYFKVVDSTNRNNENTSNVVFYDSPADYVKHRFNKVPLFKNIPEEVQINNLNQQNTMVNWTAVSTGKGNKMIAVPEVNPEYMNYWISRVTLFINNNQDLVEN